MSDLRIVDVPATSALVRRATCIHADLGPTISRLFQAIIEANPDADLLAPPMVVYTGWRETDCDIETAIPVSPGTAPGSGSELVRYPAVRAALTVHRGGYDGLPDAWMAFWDAVEKQGLDAAGAPWDSYRVGPSNTPDPADWETDLYIPLTG